MPPKLRDRTNVREVMLPKPRERPKAMRPKVQKLRERTIEQLQTVNPDLIEATIPFNIHTTSSEQRIYEVVKTRKENTAKAIQNTVERWSWFAKAAALDLARGIRLGTLNYLPPEIRQMIYGHLLAANIETVVDAINKNPPSIRAYERVEETKRCRQMQLHYDTFTRDTVDNIREFSNHDIIRLSKSGFRVHKSLKIQGASRSLRNEFDEYTLKRCSFRFTYQWVFAEFTYRLSPSQKSFITSIEIDLAEKHSPKCINSPALIYWIKTVNECWSRLDSLKRVTFNIQDSHLEGSKDEGCFHCQIVQSAAKTRGKHGWEWSQWFIFYLDILIKEFRVKAPQAKFAMPGLANCCGDWPDVTATMQFFRSHLSRDLALYRWPY